MSRLLRRRTLVVPVCAAVLGGSLVGFAASEVDDSAPMVAASELGRSPLPAGSTERGRAGLERSALRLAATLDAVPVRGHGDESTRFCPTDRLRVQWSAPLDGQFEVGGHVEPVGPAPDDAATAANGIVVCDDVSYAYMGFEARWTGERWAVASVPALSDEHGLEGEHETADEHETPDERAHGAAEEPHQEHEQAHAPEPERQPHAHAPAPAPARKQPRAASAASGFSVPPVSGIDPYASYDPQRVCDPIAKPGMLALRELLLRTYPGTRSLGISRTCSARGTSEHKEGRAFDWGVDVGVASERAAAESALSQLLKTDAAGHRHALARRLGVMYVIWNRQIWSAYSADRGWRPYSGANAHTDHVHVSLSWAGAMGRTSYWQGANATLLQVDPELQLADSPVASGGAGSGGTAAGPVSRTGGLPDQPPARREKDDELSAGSRHDREREDDDELERVEDRDDRPKEQRDKGSRGKAKREQAEPLTVTALEPAPGVEQPAVDTTAPVVSEPAPRVEPPKTKAAPVKTKAAPAKKKAAPAKTKAAPATKKKVAPAPKKVERPKKVKAAKAVRVTKSVAPKNTSAAAKASRPAGAGKGGGKKKG